MKKLKWIIGVPVAIGLIALVVIAVLLKSYDYNRFKAPVADAVRKATGRTLTIGGDIGLKLGLTPSLVVEDIRFQNASWGSRPDLAGVKRFEVQVALVPLLSKRVEIQRLILIEPDILVETDANGRTNLDFTAGAPSSESPAKKPRAEKGDTVLPGLVFNELRIERGRLTFKDGRSGKSFEATLDQLDAAMAGTDAPLKLALKGTYQKAALRLKGTLGALTTLTRKDRPWPLDLSLAAQNTDLRIQGTIADPLAMKGFDLKIDLDCPEPSALARLADAKLPVDPPVGFSGRLSDPAPATYRISDLRLTVGKSDLSGTVAVALDGKRPAITAELTSKQVDAREFLPEAPEGEARKAEPSKAPPKEKVFPADPLPLDALTAVDAKLAFQGEQILLPKVALNDLKITATLDNGKLRIAPLQAIVGGGRLDGQIRLTPQRKGAALSAKLSVDRFDVGKMLKDLAIFDAFEGKLDVNADLAGAGGSVAAIMAALDGHVSVIMDSGRISNELIRTVGGDLSSGLFRLLNPFAKKEDWTAINCLVVRFDAQKGLADASALVLDTSVMSVIGKGDVNLATEGLDLSLKPVPKEGLGVEGLGKISLSLSELAKPFKLQGTLAQPKLAVDKAGVALAAGKALGGAALFGPVGIAAALVSGKTGADENPCVSALAAARGGSGKKAAASKAKAETATSKKESAPDAAGGFGGALKKLFGD